jgi:hypothetical protein
MGGFGPERRIPHRMICRTVTAKHEEKTKMTTEHQPQQTITETTTMKQPVATNEERMVEGMPKEQWLATWSEQRIVDGVTAKKWLAIRKEAGLEIDPEIAEVRCIRAAHIDPYGIYPELREYESCVGKEYFARSPGSDIWVVFGDLPEATSAALWEKLRTGRKLLSLKALSVWWIAAIPFLKMQQ